MSTPTKNTLFDISCPDPVLRSVVFSRLKNVDMLNAIPVKSEPLTPSPNDYIEFAQGYHSILGAVKEVATSTNQIHISDGLVSEFFIKTEKIGQKIKSLDAINAFQSLRHEVLMQVNLVHVHVRHMPENEDRRMALTTLYNRVTNDKVSNETWLIFDAPDVDVIVKKIVECMRRACVASD